MAGLLLAILQQYIPIKLQLYWYQDSWTLRGGGVHMAKLEIPRCILLPRNKGVSSEGPTPVKEYGNPTVHNAKHF